MGFGSAPQSDLEEASSQEVTGADWDSHFQEALEQLRSTSVGADLYERAEKLFRLKHPASLFIRSDQSRTDAVLSREYDPSTGQEIRRRKVKIHLKQGQRLSDLVMDMAHELTHAVAEPAWDPYDPNLSALRYVKLSIEGEGGEASALMNECAVGLELFRAETSSLRRCQKYQTASLLGAAPRLDRSLIVQDFYRIGKWHSQVVSKLKDEKDAASLLGLLSPEEAIVYSSTGRSPYPVALLKEHASLMRTACENTRLRVQSREIASSSPEQVVLRNFLDRRCSVQKKAQSNSATR